MAWYERRGWQLDAAGERLFAEATGFPALLDTVRARLRRAWLRATDRAGRVFSELLAQRPGDVLGLPSAGERLHELVRAGKGGLAIVVLDAFRYDLAQQLAERLNKGEPARRADVLTAAAPVPSITSLGMALAMPVNRAEVSVRFDAARRSFSVAATGFEGDLALAEDRRRLLAARLGAREFVTFADVIDGERFRKPSRLPKLLVVHGAEFDKAGHEGELALTGCDDHLDRYVRGIRRLREVGFNRIVVVTDHGFFHWQPQPDEVDATPVSGNVLWSSRRAVVGRGLSHPQAICLPVAGSDLEVAVPRSVAAFKTYGRLGYFHGGASLQEIVVPVVVVEWPAKAVKAGVVLKPVGHIASLEPRVQVEASAEGRTLFGAEDRLLARRVDVRVTDPVTGRLIFKSVDPVTIDPTGGTQTVVLLLLESRPTLAAGASLDVFVRDAEDEEQLARERVTLKVDIDEW